MLFIRPFGIDEIDLIRQLDTLIFNDPFPEFYYQKLISEAPELQLAYWIQKNPIAYMLNKIEESVYSDLPVIHLLRLGVKPHARRLKLANTLIRHLCGIADQFGIPIILEVDVENFPAQNLYKKHLFTIIDKYIKYYPNGNDAYVMIRYPQRTEVKVV